jgi:uncharacterized protein (DUF433 family)
MQSAITNPRDIMGGIPVFAGMRVSAQVLPDRCRAGTRGGDGSGL